MPVGRPSRGPPSCGKVELRHAPGSKDAANRRQLGGDAGLGRPVLDVVTRDVGYGLHDLAELGATDKT
jgi:hypothetical protein